MKRLHYRRHSLKDGANDTIGPKGLALAEAEGQKKTKLGKHEVGDGPDAMFVNNHFARIFHGVLIRTLQTAYAFAKGLGYTPPLMPVVAEIGTPEFAAEIGTDAFKAAYKETSNYLKATRQAHGDEKAREFATRVVESVIAMFNQMAEDETAVAFGHSPMIDLVVWWLYPRDVTDVSFAEMEGIVLTFENDMVEIVDTIRVTPAEAV
ncbi:MAG: hypothetical protein A3J07_03790 [Candidatus Doudnabacteria bacterium RIFCSPLOWO2_02_FULL_49_13]|uniref:Phosphoglycerate mutase n=1 Tax=Candidatus Doudnabacteria bacterium RIFCSPHIGHO2_12_FULL_48_16 TaxID=1817838 RepID=A0A1F5PK20_9BACT|nr:MAG: hypothetical protein A3B77_02600 [Candidatus Doudnabacteria bacterium RIFCSPHIGHO2_02_FULL_49_24]OGE89597.1 MAG: hypothetical protein A2760_03805 [Candidatus Doudnabacteria bacterium RIFCSPHIGHO2_01_FULL_50_67]OGE90040.1 MAG: hypothetical protein A3E29_02935 [Candidatus Doudnabacteria bacterium RIFCSPHIGHO2_12_FULL_48_16]OGE96613.1 MAG: hypothetical protein A2990_00245 [Candidatus Doudnabacteria bacterium RIFCSPLOWO2_01_FULL_49_40]OGF03183.1 MAG: hypothetical protein A3J07_03790 [Candid